MSEIWRIDWLSFVLGWACCGLFALTLIFINEGKRMRRRKDE